MRANCNRLFTKRLFTFEGLNIRWSRTKDDVIAGM